MQFIKKHGNLFTGIRYGFAIIMTFLSFKTTHNLQYVTMSLLELLAIFLTANFFLEINKKIGNVIAYLLILLYDAQIIVLYFAGSFTSMVMLTNLDSLEDLSGKAIIYIAAIVLMILAVIPPISEVKLSKKLNLGVLAINLLLEIGALMVIGGSFTPFSGTIDLVKQFQKQNELKLAIEQINNEMQEISLQAETSDSNTKVVKIEPFYKEEINGGIGKPTSLSEKPNIILIFTEALSKNIVEDEREVMPNVKALEKDSISFENYYNHTFATYRALIGQLYSGHQLENMDENHLISLTDILEQEGYSSTWINTEPYNAEFTEYVGRFAAQEINLDFELATNYGTVPDYISYEKLFETALEKNQQEEPFLLMMYTIGTHASFDGVNQRYGDGSSQFLNKFYEMDVAFGDFIKNFKNSSLYENTIIVLTGDHACYSDEDYYKVYGNDTRECSDCDRMPLIIYFKGVIPERINAGGRNSLDMAPTLLDLLDISSENYFLGSSLFLENAEDEIEYYFYDPTYQKSSLQGKIRDIDGVENEYLQNIITRYCAWKMK